MSLFSRRRVLFGLAGTVVTSSCSARITQSMIRNLKSVEDLVLIDTLAPATIGDPMRGMNLNGTNAGVFDQPELSSIMAVSPDAGTVAWLSGSSLAHYKYSPAPEPDPKSTVFRTDARGPVRDTTFRPGYPVAMALSSRATRMAVTLRNRESMRLLIVNPETGEQQSDLTERFTAAEVRDSSIRLSEAGDYLLLAMRNSFVIMSLSNPDEIKRVVGGFSSLSPDAKTIAYVDDDHQLMLYSVAGGAVKPLLPGIRTAGVGAWSPNGRLFLAGAIMLWKEPLLIVNVEDGSTLEVHDIGERFGSTFAWIDKRFMSQ